MTKAKKKNPEPVETQNPEPVETKNPEPADSDIHDDAGLTPRTHEELERENLARYAMEMAIHAYLSLLLRPLFPFVTAILDGKPPSIEQVLKVMASHSTGNRNLLEQIQMMLLSDRGTRRLFQADAPTTP
jgi:hypothetical protein